MKKSLKNIIALAVLLIVAVAGAFGANAYGKREYLNTPFSKEIAVKLDDSVLKNIAESEKENETLNKMCEEVENSSTPIDEKYMSAIKTCQEAIIVYFNDKYSIDETENINNIKIYSYVLNEKQEEFSGVMGFSEGAESLFLNYDFISNFSDIIDGSDDKNEYGTSVDLGEFNDIVIHETLHCLEKYRYDGNDEYIDEGIIENLTYDISLYSDIKYKTAVSYTNIQIYAAEITKYDDQLIPTLFSQENFKYSNYFMSKYDIKFFEEYRTLLTDAFYNSELSNKEKFALQYYTTEIVKASDSAFQNDYSLSDNCYWFGIYYLFNK